MKKQDNESLIQELTKRLDWYIMKASDEEFDADEVQTLMKLLDNLKTEEDNVEDELPVDCLLYTSGESGCVCLDHCTGDRN